MNNRYIKKYSSTIYYLIVFFISGFSWFTAAYMSNENQSLVISLALVGLLSPMLASLIMPLITNDKSLYKVYYQQLLMFKQIKWRLLALIICIIFGSLLFATLISILLGYPSVQLKLSPALLVTVIFAFIAAASEELGWRTYGFNCLLVNNTLLSASCLFYILWSIWHIPLFFIHHTYQNGLLLLGPIYVANFFISILPATFLANWFYMRCCKSIPAAIIFHFLLVVSAELLQIEPETKFIITTLLLIITTILVIIEHNFFTQKLNHTL